MSTNNTDRDNTGVLFTVNEKKSENHPDFTGNVVIGGKKYSLSAWKKTSGSGVTYQSLSVREWSDTPPAGKTAPAAKTAKAPSLLD